MLKCHHYDKKREREREREIIKENLITGEGEVKAQIKLTTSFLASTPSNSAPPSAWREFSPDYLEVDRVPADTSIFK